MSTFRILKSHADVDADEWASISCPLSEGIHKVVSSLNEEIFNNPQFVVVKNKESKWIASLADNEGEAFDLFLGGDEDFNELEVWKGEIRLNLL